jgi:hypothetical protein
MMSFDAFVIFNGFLFDMKKKKAFFMWVRPLGTKSDFPRGLEIAQAFFY